MNTGNLVVLTLLITAMLFMVQRLEQRKRWLALLTLVPGYMIYKWAELRGQTQEMWVAVGISLAVNVVFWIAYGRRHPPEGDSITVKGMEDR